MSKFEIKTKNAILYRPLTDEELIELNPEFKNILSKIEKTDKELANPVR